MHHLLKLLTAAALCGGAVAQTPPLSEGEPGEPDMARRTAEFCADRRAHMVGQIAYLEAKLAPTESQKPLFENWKKVKLSSFKTHDCAHPPEGRPSLIDHVKLEEKMLEARLGELKAELPALQALYGSLSDEQRKMFEPSADRPPQGPEHGPSKAGGPDRGPLMAGEPDRCGPGEPPPPAPEF